MDKVLALILAGGESQRLSTLAAERAKPAMPFGGKYRIIDFTLSNCANSGVYNVAVLTQFNPGSLVQHIGAGGGLGHGPDGGGTQAAASIRIPLQAQLVLWYCRCHPSEPILPGRPASG
ncbi:sugar phosphate nucleotidyltransferase [Chloroflexota bacterium]